MSKTRKTFKYRLYPRRNQTVILEGQFGLCCELYNAVLQERRDAYRLEGKSISFRSQSDQLPEIKASREEFGGVYSQVLEDTLHRVDRSFKAFFRRLRRGEKAGFPRFRARARYDSLSYPQLGFAIEGDHLKLSKVGLVKIKLHRPIEGQIKTLTVKREAGKWYACFSVEVESVPLAYCSENVGVDVGLTHFATLSDGSEIENPRHYRMAQSALRIAQRKVARRKKGSHGMLAKSVSDAGWSAFIAKLAYKAGNAGRVLVKVDPRGTSQTCLCGASVPKTLSQRWHECSVCGLSAPRDHVSAQLILRLGLSLQAPRAAVAFA